MKLILELTITVVSPYYSISIFILITIVAVSGGVGGGDDQQRNIIGTNLKFMMKDLKRGVGTGE